MNLGSHEANAERRIIRAKGARLFYLTKYSPDLNPIEQFFAKFKHWFRVKWYSDPPMPSTMLSSPSSKPSHRPTTKLLRQRRR